MANTSDRAWRLHAPGFTKNFSLSPLRHRRDRDIRLVCIGACVDFARLFRHRRRDAAGRMRATTAVGIASRPRAIPALSASTHRPAVTRVRGPMSMTDRRPRIVCARVATAQRLAKGAFVEALPAIVGRFAQGGRHRHEPGRYAAVSIGEFESSPTVRIRSPGLRDSAARSRMKGDTDRSSSPEAVVVRVLSDRGARLPSGSHTRKGTRPAGPGAATAQAPDRNGPTAARPPRRDARVPRPSTAVLHQPYR